jgi:hypothetical protein
MHTWAGADVEDRPDEQVGAGLAWAVGGELPEIGQRRCLATPGAAPLDFASPWQLGCDVVVQRIGD